MMNPNLAARTDDPVARFRVLASRFSEILARYDIRFRPFESEELPLFSRLPEPQQKLVLEALGETLSIYGEVEASGESLADNQRVLWRTLSRLKMAPQNDIIDRITDDSVVEIYTPDARQIFRNLNFFRYFSSTLEELVSLPLYELALFPPSTLEFIMDIAMRFGQGKIIRTFVPELPPYVFKEIVGIEKLSVQVKLDYFSPILERGAPVALIAVNHSRIVDSSK